MCGIAGLVGVGNEAILQMATDQLRHRGPDDSGVLWSLKHRTGFGHRRLAVIDLSPGGHQPMTDEAGRYVVTFNGEIYNFQAIRGDLQSLGHRFRSQSDTEVLLKAYIEWGENCLERLNGMFAFAILDQETGEVFAARDRLGVKPFYYAQKEGVLVFASEIKAILASGACPIELDQEALSMYLLLQYVPPPLTMFRGIRKLPAASFLKFSREGLKISTYWSPPYSETMVDRGIDHHAEVFQTILQDATRIRMISDVPIGAYLSGGIDSSVILSEMAAQHRGPIRTYSVSFDEGGVDFDESRYASETARFFGTQHEQVVCTRQEFSNRLPEIAWYLDEPVSDGLVYPYLKLAETAKRTSTVVLTGEGADEFLHGYRYYSFLSGLGPAVDCIPGFMKQAIRRRLLLASDSIEDSKKRLAGALLEPDLFSRILKWSSVFSLDQISGIFPSAKKMEVAALKQRMGWSDAIRPVRGPSFFERTWRLPEFILMKSDKMSMASALECRSPFLDYRLVEYMVRLPDHYKSNLLRSKILLRHAYRSKLPKEVVNRPKKPFSSPLGYWLEDLSKKYLTDAEVVKAGILDRKAVQGLLKFRNGRAEKSGKLWNVLMLEVWYRRFFTKNYS